MALQKGLTSTDCTGPPPNLQPLLTIPGALPGQITGAGESCRCGRTEAIRTPNNPGRFSRLLEALPRSPHKANEVVDADGIALGAATVGVISWTACFGIAPLCAGSMDVKPCPDSP
jgi:hypothetical protein